MTIQTLALSNLRASAGNVRKAETNIDSLAASILTVGLIQNIVVVPSDSDDGTFEVAAGGRRFAALSKLVAEQRISPDYDVPCLIRSRDELSTVSLTENVQREQMNPVDEIEAFGNLADEGMSIDAIADAFGVTALVVERRLALRDAAPSLKEELRAGRMNTAQLRALCTTSDHEKQIRVWKNAYGEWQRAPKALREAVVGERVDAASDKRVAFIGGVQVFIDAGGHVERDLFSDANSSGFITDTALLEQLVLQKLEALAEPYRADGWKWVTLDPTGEVSHYSMGRVPRESKISKEVAKKISALQKAINAISEENQDIDSSDWDDATNERYDALEAELAALRESCVVFTAEAKANAGVLIQFSEHYGLTVNAGLVKAEDRKDAVAAGASVSGGRETKSAGRKGGVSDALMRSLLAHRNLAVAGEVAKQIHVAKVLTAVRFVEMIRGAMKAAPVDLAIADGYGIRRNTQHCGEDVKARKKDFHAVGLALVDKLPTAADALWDALIQWSGEELDVLNAYGTAMSVCLEDGQKGLTGKLIEALGFDMAAHFEPTVENYLGRNLPKPLIISALAEAGKATDKAALQDMKTRALASEAQKRLAGTGWVPKEIRTKLAKEPVLAATAGTASKGANGRKATKGTAPVAKKSTAKKAAGTKAKTAAKKGVKRA